MPAATALLNQIRLGTNAQHGATHAALPKRLQPSEK
jgi:hypothetical protein